METAPVRAREQELDGMRCGMSTKEGACCISEHKDWTAIKEKEQAGREGNVGT